MESRTSALVAMMVEPIRIDCLVTLSETLTPIAVRASAVQSPVGMMLQPAMKKHGIAEAVQQYTRLVRTTTDVIENWGIGEERSTSVDKTTAQPRYRTAASQTIPAVTRSSDRPADHGLRLRAPCPISERLCDMEVAHRRVAVQICNRRQARCCFCPRPLER